LQRTLTHCRLEERFPVHPDIGKAKIRSARLDAGDAKCKRRRCTDPAALLSAAHVAERLELDGVEPFRSPGIELPFVTGGGIALELELPSTADAKALARLCLGGAAANRQHDEAKCGRDLGDVFHVSRRFYTICAGRSLASAWRTMICIKL
jgi:hypothetical protein